MEALIINANPRSETIVSAWGSARSTRFVKDYLTVAWLIWRSVHLIRSNALNSVSYFFIAASISVSFRVAAGKISGLESASASLAELSSSAGRSASGRVVVRSISIVSSSRGAD